MASTGEVAAFGKDIYEAYWAALLSVNGMKLPRKNSGFLLGGDIASWDSSCIRIVSHTLSGRDEVDEVYCSV
jgi:hypothetical protein